MRFYSYQELESNFNRSLVNSCVFQESIQWKSRSQLTSMSYNDEDKNIIFDQILQIIWIISTH